jgi:hypothetical protein
MGCWVNGFLVSSLREVAGNDNPMLHVETAPARLETYDILGRAGLRM